NVVQTRASSSHSDTPLAGLLSPKIVSKEILDRPTERLVYVYGACDRSFTYRQIIREPEPQYRDRFTGRTFVLDHSLLSSLCELTLANELEIASRDKAHLAAYRERYL